MQYFTRSRESFVSTPHRIVPDYTMTPDETTRRSLTESTNGHLLLEQIAAGDTNAFSALYDTFAGATYAICLNTTTNAAAADNAMTKTWIFIWTHAATLNKQAGSTQSIVLTNAQALNSQHRTTPHARRRAPS